MQKDNCRFIRNNDFDMATKIGLDNLPYGIGFGVPRMDQPQITVALSNADDYLFVTPWTPAALFAAYICFVNLYGATQGFGCTSIIAARIRWQRYHAAL